MWKERYNFLGTYENKLVQDFFHQEYYEISPRRFLDSKTGTSDFFIHSMMIHKSQEFCSS